MSLTALCGVFTVVAAGLMMGSCGWPIKLMRRFQYEHWALIMNVVGIVIVPWCVTLTFCPNAIEAYRTIDPIILLKSNLFSLGWGVANVLCLLCFVRIGFSLTGGILAGLGVSVGVVVPMCIKGTGLFEDSPNVGSPAGLTLLAGVAVMLVGVLMVSLAGFGKSRAEGNTGNSSHGFVTGLVMAALAGVLSSGLSLAFVYSQGPIVEAMKANGAGPIAASFAVWAAGLLGGALVNVLYPMYLLTKNRSWSFLLDAKELSLSLLMGLGFVAAFTGMGYGMLLLGAFGASVGLGLQQASQMLGGQAVGFISGEWRGVHGRPRTTIYLAIAVLLVAAVIMGYGNYLSKP
jgi:L-rhamnose-H+ transport protein